MSKKFYTIDDLYQFCKENNFSHFSSKEKGAPLIISSIETFDIDDNSQLGLLPVHLKSCHIGVNRNGSSISKEVMEEHMDSFKGRPILASIIKTDTGEYEFHSHDMKINDDEIEYIEQPVGVVSQIEDPYLEYDQDMDKTYLMVSGLIFEDYSRASEILKRHKTCKCSVELAIEELSWNAAENYLSIDAFYFAGVTILGYEQDGTTPVEEGMLGSKISIDNFQAKDMFGINYQKTLLETLEKLNDTLSTFTKNNKLMNSNREGVSDKMGHFEELLKDYKLTKEDVDFDVDGLSDEDLDAIFKEHFGEDNKDNNPDTETETETETENYKKKKCSLDDNGNMTVSFEISHDDIRNALYNLIQQYEENDNDWYFIEEVYDSYFIMASCYENKYYKQSYIVDGENVSLSGERIEVFSEFITESEKIALDNMRKEYSTLKDFKEKYDLAELQAKKDEIFNRDEFNLLSDEESFVNLKNNADKFSVEEIESKAKVIFADYVMKHGEFKFSASNTHKINKIGIFNPNEKPKKKSCYGDLFD